MNSYINLITFIIITLLYFFKLKPTLTYDILNDQTKLLNYTKSNYIYLGVYYLCILLSQIVLNSAVIINLCGGSISKNIGAASLITIFPWTLIFGVVIIVLIVFPGFKSAFSDVVGYFYVSNSAHTLLSNLLLIDESIIEKEPVFQIPQDHIAIKLTTFTYKMYQKSNVSLVIEGTYNQPGNNGRYDGFEPRDFYFISSSNLTEIKENLCVFLSLLN